MNSEIKWRYNSSIDKKLGEFFTPVPDGSSLRINGEYDFNLGELYSVSWPIRHIGFATLGLAPLLGNYLHQKGEAQSIVPHLPFVLVEFDTTANKDLVCALKTQDRLYFSQIVQTRIDNIGGFNMWHSAETRAEEFPIFVTKESLHDVEIRLDETDKLLP